MKSLVAGSVTLLVCLAFIVHSVWAGPYHTKIIPSTGEPLTLTIAQNVFLRIRNFTQEGGVTRGTVMVTIGDETVNILNATQISNNSNVATPPEVMNRVVIAGPAIVTINPVVGANLAITYQKVREGAPLATPAPTATPTATPTPTP